MQRRQRNLAGAEQEQLVLGTLYTWLRSVGKNPASSIVRARTSAGVMTGMNPWRRIVSIV